MYITRKSKFYFIIFNDILVQDLFENNSRAHFPFTIVYLHSVSEQV